MIGTSYRGPVHDRFTGSAGTGSRCCAPREHAQAGCGEAVYRRPPDPAVPPSARLYTMAGREVVKSLLFSKKKLS
ncbi:unnamed protein product, partial [Staurois parvus]